MSRIQIIAMVAGLLVLTRTVHLMRQSKLSNGYSLLWMLVGIVLLILAFCRDILHTVSSLMGIDYPPTALLVIGFGVTILILLQFSTVISRLSREQAQLVHRIALLKAKAMHPAVETDDRVAEKDAIDDTNHGSDSEWS